MDEKTLATKVVYCGCDDHCDRSALHTRVDFSLAYGLDFMLGRGYSGG